MRRRRMVNWLLAKLDRRGAMPHRAIDETRPRDSDATVESVRRKNAKYRASVHTSSPVVLTEV